jgi:hypothetical protein
LTQLGLPALAVTTTNSEAAGLMTNDVAAEHNMLWQFVVGGTAATSGTMRANRVFARVLGLQ